MTPINNIIKRELNPFDQINLKPGNFWGEQQDSDNNVDSIHQEVISEVEALLELVHGDNRSRSALLLGDSGSGKSYLLGRLKRTLNKKAFFAYIGPWADSDYIWRHVLRSTVDSLIQIPEGREESQLILWLKSLSAFTRRGLKQRLFNDSIWKFMQSDRRKFINHLKTTYSQAGLYNPEFFFGVLHDLTDPELYPIACEWLRGDDLSEESMQILKVKSCIDTEEAAKNILANFGRISIQTQPIVLCFDNLDNIPRNQDGSQDFQSLFNINTTIHNSHLKNFLVLISIITNTWKLNSERIQQADKVRIDKELRLKRINLEQAEALWAYRLKPLHQQVKPQPVSPIFPLNRKLLQQSFPSGKTLPREALVIGQKEYKKYKFSLVDSKVVKSIPEPEVIKVTKVVELPLPPKISSETIEAEFQLLWQKEFKKTQDKNQKITLFSAPDLIRMLEESLQALQITDIKTKLLRGKYASYSLSYSKSKKKNRIGIVWTEDSGMASFYNVMSASQKAIQANACQTLYLIRSGSLGTAKLKGYQLFRKIFKGTKNIHIKPNLSSVHQLATYHNLVNSAAAQELVLSGKVIKLEELQELTRKSQILDKCILLQELGIVAKSEGSEDETNKINITLVRDFLLNLIKTQGFMGVPTLINQCISQFSDAGEDDIKSLIQVLCEEGIVKIIDPKADLEDQLICLVA
ncbi:MAG: ATP-binding protein [Cyanobacteria bacterium J06643_5]